MIHKNIIFPATYLGKFEIIFCLTLSKPTYSQEKDQKNVFILDTVCGKNIFQLDKSCI